jgi:outer membrane receptor protein involved in Fe transport
VQFSAPVAVASQLDDNGVPAAFYLNLRLAWDYPAWYDRSYTLYFNVANLLDRDPPTVPTYSDFFGSSAFVSGQHDPLGRRYTLGLAFAF